MCVVYECVGCVCVRVCAHVCVKISTEIKRDVSDPLDLELQPCRAAWVGAGTLTGPLTEQEDFLANSWVISPAP